MLPLFSRFRAFPSRYNFAAFDIGLSSLMSLHFNGLVMAGYDHKLMTLLIKLSPKYKPLVYFLSIKLFVFIYFIKKKDWKVIYIIDWISIFFYFCF